MKLHNNLGQKLGKLASLSTVLLALFGNAYAEEQVLDSTAAVVNNGIILESELNTHTQSWEHLNLSRFLNEYHLE